MTRYFFHIAYKGTNYRGWQRQSKVITIQEIFEDKLKQVFKYKIPCLGCGRTDAGVHASQYFFHIDVKNEVNNNLKFILNKMLPKDIVVLDIIKMDGEYHAQFDATERTYDYFIHTKRNPFLADLSSYYPVERLDFNKLKEAVNTLLKYNDFRAFCRTPDRHDNTICNLRSVKIYSTESKEQIRIQFISNKYLKSMIRIIVQKLLDIGEGNLSIEEFESYLKSKETPKYNNLAYPQGLYLSRVIYLHINIPSQSGMNAVLKHEDKSYWREV
jgi:tRNA pseudouridine38-40 synthase